VKQLPADIWKRREIRQQLRDRNYATIKVSVAEIAALEGGGAEDAVDKSRTYELTIQKPGSMKVAALDDGV
jgi:hypothetical protein